MIVHHDVAIVGAGAAGLATAIFARRLQPALAVALLEGARRPGAKILVSGGGRCNVANARVTDHDFAGGRPAIIRQVLKALPVDDTIAFFRSIGVTLHEEAGGKLFPDTNRARDVLDALLGEAARLGVELHAGCRVAAVDRLPEGGFHLDTSTGPMTATRLVLATGGRSLPKSGSDGGGYTTAARLGHTIVPQTPALAPLVLRDGPHAIHRRLSGVAHEAELTVWSGGRVARRLTGPLLWTHFGISGPVVLDASRHWARAEQPRLTASFCPGRSFDEVDRRLTDLARGRPTASVETLVSTFVPPAVAAALCEGVGVTPGPANQLGRDGRRRLVRALVEWPMDVKETRGYNWAEATAGGVRLAEIDPKTMASRVCPGLFLVGEMLDVDGRIGGFNFQWAWASARATAGALART